MSSTNWLRTRLTRWFLPLLVPLSADRWQMLLRSAAPDNLPDYLALLLSEQITEDTQARWKAEDLAVASLHLGRYVRQALQDGTVNPVDWPPHIVHGAVSRIEVLVQESASHAYAEHHGPLPWMLNMILKWCDLHPEEMPAGTTPDQMKALLLTVLASRAHHVAFPVASARE